MSDSIACHNYKKSMFDGGERLYGLGFLSYYETFKEHLKTGESIVISKSSRVGVLSKTASISIETIDKNRNVRNFEIELPWPESRWDRQLSFREIEGLKLSPLKFWMGAQMAPKDEQTAVLTKLKEIQTRQDHPLVNKVIGLLEQCRFVEPY